MPILLSDCVARVESSDNPLAMRFEPGYQPSAKGEANAKSYATGGYVSQNTAIAICQFSYGRYQIMGDNLYNELNYQHSLIAFLTSGMVQLYTFKQFLKLGGFSDVDFSTLTQEELVAFGDYYNGNGTVYAQSLIKAYQALQG